MKLIDFFMIDYETCVKIKITRQISRRLSDRSVIKKFQKLHINWFDFSKMLADFLKMLFVIDRFIDLIMLYFMTTTFNETENLRILKNVTAWIIKKKLRIEIIRSDEKLHRKKIIKWMRSVEIDFESSISRTQTQNKFVERSKNVIIKKIKTMTIISKIFVDLWKEVVDAAVYLHNKTFKSSLNWKSSFETFHEKKLSLIYLNIYECKIYAMIKHVQKKTNRLQKFVSKIHINWLIDY